ncbi:MAG: type II secretion system protein GspE, partial [Planctomycetota bacterium]
SCKVSYTPTIEEWQDLGINGNGNLEKPSHLYQGRGCEECFETGYSGRTGIYEILGIDEQVKKQILDRMPSSQIKTVAIQEGKLTTLRMAAISKLFRGITTASEVLRVTQDVDV